MNDGLVLTVANKPKPGDQERAKELAARYGLPFIERPSRDPIEALTQVHAGVFVAGKNGLSLWSREGVLRWSPGIAALRVQQFEQGERNDFLVRHAELREGDAVLDCTLGLAQDALVAARAVGEAGRVVGLEKSEALYILVAEGLREHVSKSSARIEAVHGDAKEFLRQQAEKSFDVVLFDPMFEKPRKSQPQFELLRRWADYSELTTEMIDQAKRVARRCVLIKASRYSTDLSKLGLRPLPAPNAASVVWARVPV